ncbi:MULTISPECIES: PfkB family carbohydrate kinase [Neobacillus]|uniref:Winged helix-turn-helix transcriptional regulator n=1 Tax=Neobacillus rhizophilus TaxID=2833579 RepID=A0A942YUR9_9BACI|nr:MULTISPECIES: PfkB family carbohydrate kinase [Neobacillus]MBS4213177.1 winged helix-turn-helix transcriptional regulator [Neobacillus rhizophilus]
MPEKLTEKEQLILDLIRNNPYVSQQELAQNLELSRPSIANMISGLIKKGHILGRAYILSESQHVICIGGANIDRKFHIKGQAQLGTSNPSYATQNAGGVARNIAENLGRLGLEVSLISAAGADKDWTIIEDSSTPYMNLETVSKSPEKATGSYTAVLDANGELVIALADMDVYETITPELLRKHEGFLKQSKCIIVDLNSPKETVQYLCHFAKSHNLPIVIIPVSSPKMSRLPDELDGVTWLITNRDESETYFQNEIKNDSDWKNALEKWLSLGISNVVITNGKEGSMIGNKEEGIFHVPPIEVKEIIDVTGAGDAFSSAVIYSWLEGKSLMEIAKAGSMNASKTLQSPYTVRQDLSAEQLQKDLEELS